MAFNLDSGTQKMGIENEDLKIRVSFPSTRPVDTFDPLKIYRAYEYILLENLFSPLVEMSPTRGDVVGGLAEDFYWDGSELILRLRDNLYTIDGYKITAADAEYSLKRLLVLSGNTHGNFGDLVCGSAIKSMNEPCAGIRSVGNRLILNSKAGNRSLLLPMLAAIDFAVIPKISIDPVTLKIVDYRNTSGYFFVSSDNKSGRIILKANQGHYHYDPNAADEIELVPAGVNGAPNSLDLFSSGQIDLLTTVDAAPNQDLIRYHRAKGGVLHATMDIFQTAFIFTDRGRSRLSLEQRRYLALTIRRLILKHFAEVPGFKPTSQFFPQFTYGYINDTREEIIEKAYESPISPTPLPKLKIQISNIWRFPGLRELLEASIPTISVSEGGNPRFSTDAESGKADLHLFQTDVAHSEDVNLISYSLGAGHLGLSSEGGRRWLAKYMHEESKQKRSMMLTDLHFQALKSFTLVPVLRSPYVALAREGLIFKLSPLFANNQLWLVTKK